MISSDLPSLTCPQCSSANLQVLKKTLLPFLIDARGYFLTGNLEDASGVPGWRIHQLKDWQESCSEAQMSAAMQLADVLDVTVEDLLSLDPNRSGGFCCDCGWESSWLTWQNETARQSV